MINIDFCSMELSVKSAQCCVMFDFDVKVLFFIAKHLSNIFDQFYGKCPATIKTNINMPELLRIL